MANNIDDSVENLKKYMKTPSDISKMPLSERANILTLHFIGYLAKPTGISDGIYKECIEAFNNNRGKTEKESDAILKFLIRYYF